VKSREAAIKDPVLVDAVSSTRGLQTVGGLKTSFLRPVRHKKASEWSTSDSEELKNLLVSNTF
jgi:hypothetical protein